MSIYIVYETTNIHNRTNYIGVHKQKHGYGPHDFDGYLGSGLALSNAIKKHGRESFSRKTLHVFDNPTEAYEKEKELVTPDFVKSYDNYNVIPGGYGCGEDMVTVKDKDGNSYRVFADDPRIASGELVGVNAGLVSVIDIDGNTFQVSVDDSRYISGTLKHVATGTVTVKDHFGNFFVVKKDDPRIASGELVGVNKGTKRTPEAIRKLIETQSRRRMVMYPTGEIKIISGWKDFDQYTSNCSGFTATKLFKSLYFYKDYYAVTVPREMTLEEVRSTRIYSEFLRMVEDYKIHRQEQIDKRNRRLGDEAAQTYRVIHPDGTEEIVKRLGAFCENYGLSRRGMCAVATGKAKTHKKFRCFKYQTAS